MKSEPQVCNLSAALARMGSSVETAREMLGLFREDAAIYQSQLSAALDRGDTSGAEHASHNLRGMLSTFGAEAALQVANRLERMASDGDLAAAQGQRLALDGEISRFLTIASAKLAEL